MTIYKGTVPIAGLAKNTIVNGFHIFDCKWADHLLDDISWLRADTFSWQSGSVYVTAYNELVSEYNNASSTTETEGSITFKRTPKGYKIADATQETAILNKYNTDGIAWYYILDTANTQFKLPRMKYKYWKNFTNNTLPVKGNGMTLGLIDGSGGEYALTGWGSPAYCAVVGEGYNKTLPKTRTASSPYPTNTYLGVTTDDTKSGIVADSSSIASDIEETGFYLYFYVGEYAQSAIEQTAGITSEQLNNKLDTSTYNNNPRTNAVYLKTCYVNGTSGYNIWSNGYCEQWGNNIGSSMPKITQITFAKTFSENPTVTITGFMNVDDSGKFSNGIYNLTTTYFYYHGFSSSNTAQNSFSWRVCGYLAEGEY